MITSARIIRILPLVLSLLCCPSLFSITSQKSASQSTLKPKISAKRPLHRIENPATLNPFFDALDRLQEADPEASVRVLQFGDSHTASDLWSGRLRNRLQDRFGDGGPGIILPGRPWRGYPHEGVKVLNGVMWKAESLRQKETTGLVGLTGAAIMKSSPETFSLRANFADLRVHLLVPGDQEPVLRLYPPTITLSSDESVTFFDESIRDTTLQVEKMPPTSVPSKPIVNLKVELHQVLDNIGALKILHITNPLPRDLWEIDLSLPDDDSRLLGIDLTSGKPGLILDELGLVGAELTDLNLWHPGLRRALLEAVHPQLIILAYGTNESRRSDLKLHALQIQTEAILRILREASSAPILLVGPFDQSARNKKKRHSLMTQTTLVNTAMRRAALATDCAYWDAQRAMGGKGAILSWKKNKKAQKDLVHLTAKGYGHLADLLGDDLLRAYDARKPIK